MPCTTSSFTEMQMLAGNPRYPKNDGIPPCARIYRSANGLKQSTAPVELHQRFGLPVIHLKTPPHRLLLVIIPLVQLAAVDVAPARAPGRARFHVIDVGGLPANPAPGQPADDDVVGDIKV